MTLGARVLGPLEITVDGRAHRLSAPKRRALLAALIAAAGRPVPAPRLVDELWAGEPPATATSALQVHVSALRKVVGPALRTAPGGYLPAARRLGERCAAGYRRAGDDGGLAAALNGLAITCLAQSDLDAALAHARESLDLARAAGNGRGEAISTNTVAGALRGQGRLAEAAELFGTALDRFRAAGDRRGEAAARMNLAMVARLRGDPAGARREALASLAGYRELELVEGRLDALEELACLAVADRPAVALRLLLLAERERRRLGAPLLLPDEIADRAAARSRATAALTPTEVAAVTAEAAAADLDTVVGELPERA